MAIVRPSILLSFYTIGKLLSAEADEHLFGTEISKLLQPLSPCQFTMTIQSYNFLKQPVYSMIPTMTTRLVAIVMELGGTIHVMTSLHGRKRFRRSKYALKHLRICLVHLFTLPYDAKRERPTAN